MIEYGQNANRKVLSICFILFNTLVWFFVITITLERFLDYLNFERSSDIVVGCYYISVILFSLIGLLLSKKMNVITLFYIWNTLGAFSSFLLIPFAEYSLYQVVFIALILGASLSIGFPSCLAKFSDLTVINKRGFLAGLTFSMASFAAFPFTALVESHSLLLSSVILFIWRGTSFLAIIPLSKDESTRSETGSQSFPSTKFSNKALTLYFIVWLLFCMVDRFEVPVLLSFFEQEYYRLLLFIESVIGSSFAIVGGLLCDYIGRKPVIIYGFISLGLAYAILGIFPEISLSSYLYCIADGISGGFLLTIFTLIIWGDLSGNASAEFHYFIGNIPYFVANIFRVLFFKEKLVPITVSFSIASFFLFLAVIPLLYAPETLPEKLIKQRELRKYIEKAKKLREKYEKKE